jgi:tetratricopeptide (TPR) repeat protein
VNFLLYMIGRGSMPMGIRPGRRELLLAAGASHAADGRYAAALDSYRTLAEGSDGNAMDELICGHLHFVMGEVDEAALCFISGAARLQEDERFPQIQRLLARSSAHLTRGEFKGATGVVVQARALMEALLAAEAGIMLCGGQADAVRQMIHWSDLTLRLLTRIELAAHLAQALEERGLEHAIGLWAITPGYVRSLLVHEFQRLAKKLEGQPHMEMTYRAGLLARAMGNMRAAADAFERVLGQHPYHVPSAVRLAVRAMETGGEDEARVRAAFLVPGETLRLFGQLAMVAGRERGKLEGLVAHSFCDGGVDRANLSFALSELGMPEHGEWAEAAAADQSV